MNDSKGKGKGIRLKLESQNDEAYLTGRRGPQEKEKQIRTPLRQEKAGGPAKTRGASSKGRR